MITLLCVYLVELISKGDVSKSILPGFVIIGVIQDMLLIGLLIKLIGTL